MLLAILAAATIDLRVELVRESLTGTHYRYRQYVNGEAVAGGEVNVTVANDGTRTEINSQAGGAPPAAAALNAARPHHPLNLNGVLRYARREVVELDALRKIVRYVDDDGAVLLERPQFAHANVFDPNPVTKLNDPSLRDGNDSAAAVPPSAYSDVVLDHLNASGPLGGMYVQIVDTQNPAVAPVDAGGQLAFDRSASGFEDVNAYHHLDRSQTYLQSLGYTGGRTLVPYPVEVDTHAANGRDDSFFVASPAIGRGMIFFGEGGTDDAEDSDLVVHEYAHAIHEWISPGTFLGTFASEGRAIGEGFGDYWAFSATYDASLASGRDPFCFADWDARCAGDADSEGCAYTATSDCLRRLDSPKTMSDYVTVESSGVEHRNGEIWSSALREIFIALRQRHGTAGKKIADAIVIESLFGAPPNPSFAGIAGRMIGADRLLNSGANADVICAAMSRRGILTGCASVPRGEITVFESSEQGIAIPDNDTAGVTLPLTVSDTRAIERLEVSVVIRHSLRGDLALVLIAPDGTETVLQNFSSDRAADIVATYGRDALAVGSLDRFRGRSAAGVWKLRVSDVRPRDVGTVVSWSLAIQFAGDVASSSRPASELRQIIAAAAHAPGANGTYWMTDVRLFAARETTATLIFTPSGADGRSTFAAVRVHIAANTTVAFDDIVSSLFATSGTGQIEIQGDVLATSRTYTTDDSGTYGQGIVAWPADRGHNSVTLIARVDERFRTNVGIAETNGGSGIVRILFGDPCSSEPQPYVEHLVLPFSHLQIPIPSGDAVAVAILDGDAQVIAYRSTIDNRSGDPTFSAGPERYDGITPAIRSAGAFGTLWRTEVRAARTPVEFFDTHGARTFTNSESCSVQSADALKEWFGIDDSRGILRSANFETRVYTTGPRGTYGTALPLSVPFGGTRQLLHIDNSRSFRTNIGLMTEDEPAAIVLTLLDASGAVLRRSEHLLSARSLEQFTLSDPVTNGRVQVDVVSGRAVAYASIVDNRSGDPIFVPAQ